MFEAKEWLREARILTIRRSIVVLSAKNRRDSGPRRRFCSPDNFCGPGSQVRQYLAKLKEGIARVAAEDSVYTDVSALYPTLRMAHCEHHYVFCLPRAGAPALIVAILHERMDLMTRVADRLHEGAVGQHERHQPDRKQRQRVS